MNLIRVPPSDESEFATATYVGMSEPDIRRGFKFGRIIQALDKNCRVILQRWNEKGIITDFLLLTFLPLQFALIPPSYESILLNSSGDESARFFVLYAKEETCDITTIQDLNGAGYRLKKDGGLVPNENYTELPVPRIHPAMDQFRFLYRWPLYDLFTNFPKGFDFIDPPRPEFFAGSV